MIKSKILQPKQQECSGTVVDSIGALMAIVPIDIVKVPVFQRRNDPARLRRSGIRRAFRSVGDILHESYESEIAKLQETGKRW